MNNHTQLLNDALASVRDGTLHEKTDEQLNACLQALRLLQQNSTSRFTGEAIEAIVNEMNRRIAESQTLRIVNLHNESLQEQKNVRQAIEALQKPHWTITPGFIVGVLAMVFAAIAAWPIIHSWFR